MYNKELEDLIQEFLTDGIISDKERQVLLNKAKELGLNVDEVDLYIDAQQQKADQAVDSAVNKRRGKTCPYCGESIPLLTDKCPHCGGNITPEASKELEEIIDHLETALVNFKAGENAEKSKAEVERYVRKARLYYSNNPKVKLLLEEVKYETKEAKNEAKKKANKQFLANLFNRNKKGVIITIIIFLLIGLIWHSCEEENRHNEKLRKEYQEERKEEEAKRAENVIPVKNTAEEVNKFLEKGQVDKAANALTMCEISDLGDYGANQGAATSIYTGLISNVVDAYLAKGQKKKAQNLVIACSPKFHFGKSDISDLFKKLGSDGNYEFN